jgi:hypothetical protein
MKIIFLLSIILSTSMTSVPEQFVKTHQCASLIGPSCVVDLRFPCPPGYFDGCITNETDQHMCIPSDYGPSCRLDMSLNCPEHFQDACLTGESDYHLCMPKKGRLCGEESLYSCPAGFEDPC